MQARRWVWVVSGLVLSTGGALAAPVDAGNILQSLRGVAPFTVSPAASSLPSEVEERPVLKAGESVQIPVKGFRITGNRVVAEPTLQSLVQDGIGQPLTLADLNRLAGRISQYYRQRGYLLARAYIPQQDVVEGVVEIAVLEGRLGRVNVYNTSLMGKKVIGGYLGDLADAPAVGSGELERRLLLLNDLPGVDVRSTLTPGASVGTSNLDIAVAGTGRLGGSISLDNFGNRYTGSWRAGATVGVNNLAGRGDLLQAQVISSGPGMGFGRMAWQTPIGQDGWRLGAAWSAMRYRLGKDFASLEAHGEARIGTVYASYPFIRRQVANLSGQLAFDHKVLQDYADYVSMATEKRLDVVTAGLSGEHVDAVLGGGVINYSLAWSQGNLHLDAASAELDKSVVGHNTGGSYGRLAWSAARLQRLSSRFAVFASLAGQQARKNLDSSEKFSLGGALGVRGYPQGEAAGDTVWLGTLELRYGMLSYPGLQWLMFADSGASRVNHTPLSSDTNNSRRLRAAGLGVQWQRSGEFALKGFLAWRSGPRPTSDDERAVRVWVQAVKSF